LDKQDTATADRGGYFAIHPGDPDGSLAYQRMSSKDDSFRMPPAGSGVKPLTPDEVETIRLWILGGAKYKAFWAFVPPEESTLPAVSDPSWPRGPIDRFVMAGLDDAGLKPEKEADPATLARRASLVLTGLPPSVKSLDEFLNDKRPDAYERYVDKLMASPQYGEHQARYWLDAVRYADTHGLHFDNERSVWPYRDWVVRAFNEDLPMNKFALWQLAGDLLPHPTTEQLIATTYVRLNPTTNEGGAIAEEYLAKNTMDRVDTMGTVFLGLTVGCAKCHDHKYDPITQKEYYGLYAYFDSTADAPLDGNLLAPPPAIRAPNPQQEAVLLRWKKRRASIEDAVEKGAAQKWINGARTEPPIVGAWQIAGPYAAADFDKAFAGEFDPETAGKTPEWRDLKIELGKLTPGLVKKENAAAYLRTVISAPNAEDVVLRLGSDDGIKVWLNDKSVFENKVLRGLTADADKVTIRLKQGKNTLVFKIVNAGGADGFYMAVGDPRSDRINKVFADLQKPKTADERELASVYLDYGPESEAASEYMSLGKRISELENSLPMTMIAQEMPEQRETHLLSRGQYDLPKEVVQRGIPEALGTLPKDAPDNRLGLAEWITEDDNPLYARVTVNRIWQECFGMGLVKSAENFGSQGSWPSDPELLDYLAVELRKSGWSAKSIVRKIVTSATFRQASTTTAEKRTKDPENALLSRGPRFRMDAEVIRDQALKVAGLLVYKIGGHGVKTYQPPGLWSAIGYPASDTAKFVQDHGEALYRRSLYLFWKRTSPPPAMEVYDAPSREACIARRSRTDTPLQALVTMNDPQYVEAARVMANHLLKMPGDDQSRLTFAFESLTARKPNEKETAVILDQINKQRTHYAADKKAAVQLISTGEFPRDESLDPVEHAAWTVVCNMLMNLDEAVTIH
ncbi:MAG TPA: PSD1 and planctomycete cytochrome C domain-containing protein, partial [Fimbriimonadaceae bacterium]|nr:PSD1 and planctomycete cytochrome C domain-containing protein [Fimbriimonadaceae bacterium]